MGANTCAQSDICSTGCNCCKRSEGTVTQTQIGASEHAGISEPTEGLSLRSAKVVEESELQFETWATAEVVEENGPQFALQKDEAVVELLGDQCPGKGKIIVPEVEIPPESVHVHVQPASLPTQPSTDTSRSSPTRLSSKISDPQLLRATSLRTTLRRLGVLWRTHPSKHPEPAQLYEYSFSCSVIDQFLSHSWSTPGWLKYVALLWRSESDLAFAVSLLVVLLCSILTSADILPTMGTYTSIWPVIDWEGEIQKSNWSTLLGPFTMLVSMFCSAAFAQGRCCRSAAVFLDVVCIHQTDPVKKQEGIDSLAAFLRHTSQMTILWNEEYFGRLWCVYELASYLKLNPAGQLVFFSMFEVVALFLIFTMYWLTALLFFELPLLLGKRGTMYTLPPLCGILLLTGVPAVHKLRGFMQKKKDLLHHLQAFDCQKANCFLPEDRVRIMQKIQEWFGSEELLNAQVRGSIRREVQQAMARTYFNSCRDYLKVSLPLIASFADTLSSMARSSVPPRMQLLFAVWCVTTLQSFALFSHLIFALVDKFGAQKANTVANACLSIRLTLFWLIAFVLSIMIATVLYKRSFVVVLIYITFWTGMSVGLLLHGARHHCSKVRTSENVATR